MTSLAASTETSKNPASGPVYTQEQVDDYHAVLFHEAGASITEPKNKEKLQFFLGMAGGTGGKSALLNRIAAGLAPLVMAPPVSYSYPWYDAVESDRPSELMMSGNTTTELLEQGRKWVDLMEVQGEFVLINQSAWRVVKVIDESAMEVCSGAWDTLGFIWLLSLDTVPAAESPRAIVSWHDPSLGKIRTMEQLQREQRWHVEKRIEGMRTAHDPVLAAQAVETARLKDLEASHKMASQWPAGSVLPFVSRFNAGVAQSANQAFQSEIAQRIEAGLPPIPLQGEIEQRVAERLARYLTPANKNGFGWYSQNEAGELLLHTWRLHRRRTSHHEKSIYLDMKSLPRAPVDFHVA